jgi:rubrerythrin
VSIRFTADEVLAIAEQIERNGARYYEAAAKITADASLRDLLLDLAARERVHEQVFSGLRGVLTLREKEANTQDPYDEIALYLQALADASVFRPQTETAAALPPGAGADEVLRHALALEKDSIVFYAGMREVVAEAQGRARVDEILREEMRHVATLTRELASRRP